MSSKEIFEIAGIMIGSLGGGALIVFAFSNWLGKIWANRLMAKEKAEYAQELESLRNRLTQDTESYKVKLKKSEFIFEKEYEATSEFVSLHRSIIPTYSHPDMDWYEVCNEIAVNFDQIERRLVSFLSNHGAVLPEEVKDLISRAIGLAGDGKFRADSSNNVEGQVNSQANNVYEKIKEAEKCLLEHIHSQSSTKITSTIT